MRHAAASREQEQPAEPRPRASDTVRFALYGRSVYLQHVVARAARGLALAGVVYGFGGATLSTAAPSTGRLAAGACPVSIPGPNGDYGSRMLRADLPRGGKMVVSDAHPPLPRSAWFGQIHADGSISVKLAWAGSARRQLTISGARLDAHARPLRASVATGTPHFWASRLTFVSSGCWRVTGRAGTARLSFVLAVRTASP